MIRFGIRKSPSPRRSTRPYYERHIGVFDTVARIPRPAVAYGAMLGSGSAMRNSRLMMIWGIIAIWLSRLLGTPAFGFRPSTYIVTVEPISVHAGPGGLCVAIDPADQTGIWWWGPGRSGCASRNTFPGPRQENARGLAALFHALNAVVSTDSSGTVHARFRLGMHGQPEFIDVELISRAGVIRCPSTQAEVPAKRINPLDIPFDPPL